MNARTVLNRVYADYLMPDRIGEYEGLLRKALDRGYRHLTFGDYARPLKAGGLDDSVRYFIHRHDIDTDVGTARRMFEGRTEAWRGLQRLFPALHPGHRRKAR